MEIPYAKEKQFTYENIIAKCPICGNNNIYNRKTDLKSVEPIALMQVNCFNKKCKSPFYINGDSINSAHEMLIFDCEGFKKEKKYSYCITNLSQAFEVFFSLYLRVYLIYRPYKEIYRDLDTLKLLETMLFNNIKGFGYTKLCNIFINSILTDHKITSVDDAKNLIDNLKKLSKQVDDSLILSYKDPSISNLLMHLNKSKVDELRNKVVHQHAYRPNIQEVEEAIDETRSILFPLGLRLGIIGDDFSSYLLCYT